LSDEVVNKIYDLGFSPTIKIVLNVLFNLYDENKAKELISSIVDDTDYKLIDLRGKMIYREITEKDYLGDDIGHRGCWGYVDEGNWVLFIQKNTTEDYFKELLPKLTKLSQDKEVKIRFIWAITEKLLGEKKTKDFFEENNLIPKKDGRVDQESEVKYLINIGEKTKKNEPEYTT
jgi:hypothetical protein